MKKIYIILFGIFMLGLVGCGTNNIASGIKLPVKVTAQTIVDKLKVKEGKYMTNITVSTAANDSNKLLGRPNSYTEKINWNDSRDADKDLDCTIEVFNNKEDATTRKTYIDAVNKAFPVGVQYSVQKDNTYLRIEGALTPAQAKEYTDIFSK